MLTTTNFEPVTCCNCGIVFQVPEEFDENRQEDGKLFFCPNGHAQSYEDSDDEKIEVLEAKNRELQIEVRQLKCKLLGHVGMRQKINMWWRGGLY